jgi:hypothetical protein
VPFDSPLLVRLPRLSGYPFSGKRGSVSDAPPTGASTTIIDGAR